MGTAATVKTSEGLLPAFAEALLSLGFGDMGGTRKSKGEVKQPIQDEDRPPVGFAIPVPIQSPPLPPIAPVVQISDLHTVAQISNRRTVAQIPDLHTPIAQIPDLRTPVAQIPDLRTPVAQIPDLHTPVAQIPDLRTSEDSKAADRGSALLPAEDLTFAARVQPADLPQKAASAAPATIVPATAKKVIESDVQDAPPAADVTAVARAIAAFEPNGRLAPPPPEAPSTPSKPVGAAVPVASTPIKPPAQPLKDLSLEMAQPGAQKVEVRLFQQSGELRVAVRTGDSELAHGLRQSLPELVGRLEENGFHTETWRPGVPATPGAEHVVETRSASASGSSQSGDPQSRSGSQQQNGHRPRQQSNRPDWVEELESSTGESYGIGN